MNPERVLAVFAHPDDESLLAGGTLAALAAAGLDVVLICATCGEKGSISSPEIAAPDTLGKVREAELHLAAHALGIRSVECLNYPDGEVQWTDPSVVESDLIWCLRHWQPKAVITFGPEGWYWHPDHIAVHEFTLAVLHILAREGIVPWIYQATWPQGKASALVAAMGARGLANDLWGLNPDAFGAPPESITTVLDVRRYLPDKLRAVRSHRSQFGRDHVLQVIPDDLAADFLGYESFIRARPQKTARDWLMDVVQGKQESETAIQNAGEREA